MYKAVQNKSLKGVAASARGPTISHLFFADDNLIFGRATVREGEEIQRVRQVYEESSSQQLNRSKTSLYFKLPNTLCEELTVIVRQFWWSQVKHEKKLAWWSWERGGKGFWDL